MPFDVRPCADHDELVGALAAIGQYFNWNPADGADRHTRNMPVERMHAAFDDGRIVGGAGSFRFDWSVPGGSVACAGITAVGVYPTDRRRGALTAMMRAQLDDVHERGEPIAALWASESTIYGRYGYGMASLAAWMELPRDRSAYAAPLERRGRVRLVEVDEAKGAFASVWERVRAARPAMFARSETWWQSRVLTDPPHWRDHPGPKRLALLEIDGAPEAYAIYRHDPRWEGGSSTGKLLVLEALGATPQATAEMWRYLLDVDWMGSITGQLLPVDHPLLVLLAEPRRMGFRIGDRIWIRLVDVGAALAARSYAAGDPLVFDIADAFCPWNEGRWKLAGGRVDRTDEEPDLRCDVAVLGAAYLGGITFRQLADGGRVEELRPGAVARADVLFRSDRAPWCPEIF